MWCSHPSVMLRLKFSKEPSSFHYSKFSGMQERKEAGRKGGPTAWTTRLRQRNLPVRWQVAGSSQRGRWRGIGATDCHSKKASSSSNRSNILGVLFLRALCHCRSAVSPMLPHDVRPVSIRGRKGTLCLSHFSFSPSVGDSRHNSFRVQAGNHSRNSEEITYMAEQALHRHNRDVEKDRKR